MSRVAHLLASFALSAAIVMGVLTARASPQDVFGFGPRSSALGATGVATAEGYEAVYHNPALLSLAPRRSVALGFVSAIFDLRAGTRVSCEPLQGGILGAVLPVPFGGILKDRVALGLGFFTPFALVVRGRILFPERPQFPIADRTQSVAIQAGVGVDLGHGIRLGGGFAALAALTGSVVVAADASGRMGTTVDDTLLAVYGPIAGASLDLGAFRLGFAVRGPLAGRFNVVITVKDLGDLVVPPLNISGVAQYDPLEVTLELGLAGGPWRVAAGAAYKRWSAFPGVAEPTVRCPLLDSCTAKAPPAPGWHDTVVPRLGVERRFEPSRSLAMSLRAGFFFEPTPSPEQTGASNLYENARAAVTLGYGVELGPQASRVSLDLFGQAQALVPRTHVKEAGHPRVETGGAIGVFGATAGVKL